MKKFSALFLAALLLLTLCACGNKQEEEPFAGMPNPIHECTKNELVEATGIALDAPEGAQDVAYSYISHVTITPISQVQFKLDGKKFCYRAQPTSFTSIQANVDENASSEDLFAAIKDCTNIGASLSGMYYNWESICLNDIAGSREAIVAFNEGKEGFISWLDVVPGILYSLSVDTKAGQDLLIDTAELCFVPTQGDVG